VYLCVLCGSENKQTLFPYKALTEWIYNGDLTFQTLPVTMYCQFNVQQFYAQPTLYLCVLYLSENKQRLVPLTA